MHLEHYGGDATKSDSWDQWVQSIKTYPAIIYTELADITLLVSDNAKRSNLANSIAAYLTGTRQRLR